jgi:hypothetical protein
MACTASGASRPMPWDTLTAFCGTGTLPSRQTPQNPPD